MDKARAVVFGHLALATSAIAAIVLVPFFCLRMFGPFLFVYYVLAGITFGWQWYSFALPGWKRWLLRKGVQEEELQRFAHRAGLYWPLEAPLGPFAIAAIEQLRRSVGKVVRLTRPDGEVIVAKISLVDPLDEEIVFDMLSTTDESKYEKFDREPAYLLYFKDVSSVDVVTDSTF